MKNLLQILSAFTIFSMTSFLAANVYAGPVDPGGADMGRCVQKYGEGTNRTSVCYDNGGSDICCATTPDNCDAECKTGSGSGGQGGGGTDPVGPAACRTSQACSDTASDRNQPIVGCSGNSDHSCYGTGGELYGVYSCKSGCQSGYVEENASIGLEGACAGVEISIKVCTYCANNSGDCETNNGTTTEEGGGGAYTITTTIKDQNMKLSIPFYIALSLLSISSCNLKGNDDKTMATVQFIVTDGKPAAEFADKNTITDFSSLKMRGVGSITYEQADSTSLTIKGPLNLLDKIIVENHGDELYISFDPNYKNLKDTKNIYYHITSPVLNDVDIKGVTTFYNENLWTADELNLSVKGVGEINAKNIKSRKLDVNMDGVGKINVNVNCEEISTEIKGVGTVDISGETGTIEMENKGIGKIDTSKLKVRNQ